MACAGWEGLLGKILDLTGQRFGMLTALYRLDETENRYYLWECKCDCGGQIKVTTKHLKRGTITNCGCIPKMTAQRGSTPENLLGQRFGLLLVTGQAENHRGRTRWHCRCDCGNTHVVTAHELKSGKTKSCGSHHHKKGRYRVDLTGMTIGRLKVNYLTDMRDYKGSLIWHCTCSCGKDVLYSADGLLHGNIISCGCRKKEVQKCLRGHLTFVENTCIEWLRSRKTRCDNTSGFRGVCHYKGRWRVSIGLKNKRYHCGTYKTFEEAKAVRLEVERLLHEGFVNAWEKWTAIAEKDPSWAVKNPFVFEVIKHNGELKVYAPILLLSTHDINNS